MKEFLSKSLEDTKKVATDFASLLNGGKKNKEGATVVGLYGELGSGKTTFMKFLAQALGVKEEITSPTFVIMKNYRIQNPESRIQKSGSKTQILDSSFHLLIHIDAYRLEKGEELKNLGWDEIVSNPQNLICIEWPEKVAEILPPHIMVKFEHVSEGERKISIA